MERLQIPISRNDKISCGIFLAIKIKWNIDAHENRKNLQHHYPEWKEDKCRRIHTVRVHSDVVLEQVKLIYSDRDQISGYLEWSLYGALTAMDKMDLLEGDESSIIVMWAHQNRDFLWHGRNLGRKMNCHEIKGITRVSNAFVNFVLKSNAYMAT